MKKNVSIRNGSSSLKNKPKACRDVDFAYYTQRKKIKSRPMSQALMPGGSKSKLIP